MVLIRGHFEKAALCKEKKYFEGMEPIRAVKQQKIVYL
jgi:hypothetical protein